MTDILQSGHHPDADQLTAFVEQTLPLHEQQATLAHLSTCADCRAVVFLADSAAADTLPQPTLATPQRRWFTWNLAWIAAPVLACLVLVTLHLRQISRKTQPAPIATAEVLPAPDSPPPTSPTDSPEPRSRSAQLPSVAPLRPAIKEPTASSKQVRQSPPALSRAENSSYSQLPLSTRSSQSSAVTSAASSTAPLTPADALGQGIYAGTGQQNLNRNFLNGASAAAAERPSPPLYIHNASSLAKDDMPSADKALPSMAQQNIAPPPPAAAAPAPLPQAQAAAGAVALAASAQLAQSHDNASIAGSFHAPFAMARAANLAPQPMLPSHLPVRSIVSNASQQLALDASGALFRSQDAGVNWQLVPSQWTGRAIRVSLTPLPVPQLAGNAPKPAIQTASPTAAVAPTRTYELTTDQGEHWISTDGQSWKRN